MKPQKKFSKHPGRKIGACVLSTALIFGSVGAIVPFISTSTIYGAESQKNNGDIDLAKLSKEFLKIVKKISSGEIEGLDENTVKEAIDAIKKATEFLEKNKDTLEKIKENQEALIKLREEFPDLDIDKLIESLEKSTNAIVDAITNQENLDNLNKLIENLNTAYDNVQKIIEAYDRIVNSAENFNTYGPASAIDGQGKWIRSSNGKWWFNFKGGGYPANQFVRINNEVYHFDNKGWMDTGWVYADKNWYFMKGSGQMTYGWQIDGGKWYFMYKDGHMARNEYIGSYYVNKSGVWTTSRWIKSSNGKWWYSYKEGGYPANEFATIGGKKYHFDSKGWMDTGWVYDKGLWYYMDSSGAMTYGWQKVSGKWYFMYEDGHMAHNEYVGSYYVNKSGVWTTSHWVKSSNGKWWYSYKEGGYPANEFAAIGGKNYHFDSKGWMDTGWVYDKGHWYYMDSSGAMTYGWQKVRGKWYFMYEDGTMASNTKVNGYKVDKSGAWIA